MPRKNTNRTQDFKVARAKRWQDAIAPVLPKLHLPPADRDQGGEQNKYSVTVGCLVPGDGLFRFFDGSRQDVTQEKYNENKYSLYLISTLDVVKRLKLGVGDLKSGKFGHNFRNDHFYYRYNFELKQALCSYFQGHGGVMDKANDIYYDTGIDTCFYKNSKKEHVLFIKPEFVQAFLNEICHAEDLGDNSVVEDYFSAIPEGERDQYRDKHITPMDEQAYLRMIKYHYDESFGGKFDMSNRSLQEVMAHAREKNGKTRDVLIQLSLLKLDPVDGQVVLNDHVPDFIQGAFNAVKDDDSELRVKDRIIAEYKNVRGFLYKHSEARTKNFDIFSSKTRLVHIIKHAIEKDGNTRAALVNLGYLEVDKDGKWIAGARAPECIRKAFADPLKPLRCIQ